MPGNREQAHNRILQELFMTNMMTKLGVAILTGLIALPVFANQLEHLEFAAEVLETRLGNAPVKGGLIYVKRCDECKTEGVSFDNRTLYFQESNLISASEAQARDGNGATIFFHPKSKLVTRVVFWATEQ